jgi:large subunit ribosomal protein L13
VIINAEKAKFTGVKLEDKEYFTHSGYFGSTKSKNLGDMLETHTDNLYKLAVRGMLPKTTLGRQMLKKLKVYAGAKHPHTAQINKEA